MHYHTFHALCRSSLGALTVIAGALLGSSALAADAPAPAAAVVATPGSVAFEQAVDMAISSSTHRAMAEQDLAAQTARRQEANASIGPKVGVEAADLRFDKPVSVDFGGAEFPIRQDYSRTATLVVSQSVTQLYSGWQRSRLERSKEDTSALSVDLAKSQAAFAAAEAYRKAQASQEMVRIANASLAATVSQERDASALVDSGRLIRSDLLKIQIAHQEANAQVAKTVANRQKAFEQLRYVLGLSGEADFNLDPLPSAEQVAGYDPGAFPALTAKAEETRVEIKQANLGLETAARAQRVSAARYAPDVNVFAQWDREYGVPPFGVPPYTRTYGVKASWELWDDGARLYANRAVAAEAQKAEVNVRETKDKLRVELYSLLADLQAAKVALIAARGSVAQAEEAYRLDNARFGSGLVTATDLVLSETGQTRARGAVVAAVTEVDLLALAIQRSLGDARPHSLSAAR